jgi:DNA polymerase-1
LSSTNLPKFLTNPDPEVYLNGSYIVVDFETTTFRKGLAVYPSNRTVGVAYRHGPAGILPRHNHRTIWRRQSEYELGKLVDSIQQVDFLVCHNAKFDLQWLARCGLDLSTVLVYDTLLGEYVLSGNRGWQLSLEAVARRRWGEGKLDLIGKLWDADIPTEDIPEEWLRRYCVRDVELTERLFLEQRGELSKLGLLPVLYNRCLLTPVLADIELNGMQLDKDLVRNKSEELERRYAEIQRELDGISGGINFASPLQLGVYLYETLGLEERRVKKGGKWCPDRTPSGRRKVDADTISLLKPKTAEQRKFLATYKESRAIYNELTKYLRNFQECVDQTGGRLLGSLNQSRTRTHRLSSTGLEFNTQFQNFPRTYKPLFKARKAGWLIGEADGAQLEFRVACYLGRDRTGLADIVNGTDIHAATAQQIWPGCDPKGINPDTNQTYRQDAKEYTFKPLYGGSSGTPDEKRYYEFFRQRYEGITRWQKRNIDFVLENKYLETEWGLRYYWPDTRLDGNYVTNSTAICNYPVQAFATAEIIPIVLVWFWHRLKRSGLQTFVVNTVHDSIIVELPEEEIDAFNDLCRQAFSVDVYRTLRDLYNIKLSVPLGTEVKTATHWGGKGGTKATYEAEESLWNAQDS